ncbi:MAG: 2-oxoacid:acceptor oxidoreductase family protein [Candidatus Omnitrophota bacterium]
MTERIIIAGSGGQGIMLLGKVLALAAMREGNFVTLLPAYGPEVRGGTAHCRVIISREEISSPFIGQADSLIIFNRPSFEKFISRLKDKGSCLVNSSLASKVKAPSVKVYSHPFTDMALSLGNIKVANMVALGCFVAAKKIVRPNSVLAAIKEIAPSDKQDLVEINWQALEAGMRLING